MTPIWEDIQNIVNTRSEKFRASLNKNVHVMDVGIAALKASDPTIDFAVKEKLHRLFRKEFFVFHSLEAAVLHSRDTGNIDRSAFVEDPKLGDYIVAPSYSTMRTRVTSALKFSTVSSRFTGIDESTGKATTNIGHLSLKNSVAATSPLESKLQKLIEVLQGAPIASSLVASKLKALHREHVLDTNYVFNRANFDILSFQNALGTGSVLVTLQTTEKNAALAKEEAKIERELRSYLTSEKFRVKLVNQKGSNSVLEDIFKGIISTLRGKKDKVPGSTHAKKPTAKSSSKLINTPTVKAYKPQAIRNLQGHFYSLANLQTLLNSQLQDVISANMGDGSAKRILNYRTGRFASSAKVERLSASREGMITAFYSYMKNPYQTFEPGFKQGSPKTRDPKLLISQSIRDIAATRVMNKLRTVSI